MQISAKSLQCWNITRWQSRHLRGKAHPIYTNSVIMYSSPCRWKTGWHFWCFTAKQCCSVCLNNWSRLGLVLKLNNLKEQKTTPSSSSSNSPEVLTLQLDLKRCCFYPWHTVKLVHPVQTDTSRLAAIVTVLVWKGCTQALFKVNFQFPETVIRQDKLYGAISGFMGGFQH